MGVFPVLRLTHLIPKERVTADYLVRMAEASTTSNYLLACKWQNILPPNPFSPLGLLSVFKNIVVNRGCGDACISQTFARGSPRYESSPTVDSKADNDP